MSSNSIRSGVDLISAAKMWSKIGLAVCACTATIALLRFRSIIFAKNSDVQSGSRQNASTAFATLEEYLASRKPSEPNQVLSNELSNRCALYLSDLVYSLSTTSTNCSSLMLQLPSEFELDQLLFFETYYDNSKDSSAIVKYLFAFNTKNQLFITFCGSRFNGFDWYLNFMPALKNMTIAAKTVPIHAGFQTRFLYFSANMKELCSILSNNAGKISQIIFCGHSLGGALSTLAFSSCTSTGGKPIDIPCRCITFAAPKMFPYQFSLESSSNITHYEARTDLLPIISSSNLFGIASVPLFVFLGTNVLAQFWNCKYLDKKQLIGSFIGALGASCAAFHPASWYLFNNHCSKAVVVRRSSYFALASLLSIPIGAVAAHKHGSGVIGDANIVVAISAFALLGAMLYGHSMSHYSSVFDSQTKKETLTGVKIALTRFGPEDFPTRSHHEEENFIASRGVLGAVYWLWFIGFAAIGNNVASHIWNK